MFMMTPKVSNRPFQMSYDYFDICAWWEHDKTKHMTMICGKRQWWLVGEPDARDNYQLPIAIQWWGFWKMQELSEMFFYNCNENQMFFYN